MNGYVALGLAIVAEVIATSALKASDSFTRLVPSLITAAGYLTAFWLLSITLRTVPVGVAYAIWSGLGIVLITAAAWLLYGQRIDWPAAIGMGLIIAGVAVLNLFSKTTAH